MQDSNLDDPEVPVEEQIVVSEASPSRKTPCSLSDLAFVRLIDPIHIPSYLIEQMKDRMFEVENFYAFQSANCLIATDKGPQLNPGNFLFALVHERLRQVKGFLWMTFDMLTNSLLVNSFSMDKEYWNKGEAMDLLEEKAKKVMRDLKISRIVWITKNSKFCENKGFKKSKESVMIYEE